MHQLIIQPDQSSRAVHWRRRVTIAFMVEETDVVVIGIFYGGRDFESLLEG